MGVGLTILKRLCRKHGVARWPHRARKSVERLLLCAEVGGAAGAGVQRGRRRRSKPRTHPAGRAAPRPPLLCRHCPACPTLRPPMLCSHTAQVEPNDALRANADDLNTLKARLQAGEVLTVDERKHSSHSSSPRLALPCLAWRLAPLLPPSPPPRAVSRAGTFPGGGCSLARHMHAHSSLHHSGLQPMPPPPPRALPQTPSACKTRPTRPASARRRASCPAAPPAAARAAAQPAAIQVGAEVAWEVPCAWGGAPAAASSCATERALPPSPPARLTPLLNPLTHPLPSWVPASAGGAASGGSAGAGALAGAAAGSGDAAGGGGPPAKRRRSRSRLASAGGAGDAAPAQAAAAQQLHQQPSHHDQPQRARLPRPRSMVGPAPPPQPEPAPRCCLILRPPPPVLAWRLTAPSRPPAPPAVGAAAGRGRRHARAPRQ